MSRPEITQGIDRDMAEAIQTIDTRFLLAIIHGTVDPVLVAKRLLADRGLDPGGRWIGFSKAYEAHGL